MVFKLCDDQKLLLLDLADLKAVLHHLTGDDSAALLAEYGGVSKATVGVLLRKIVEMEQQGAGRFFGEPEFEVEELLRVDDSGRGMVTLLELEDIQDRPALFSTFLMWLLASLYRELPEVGDLPKPKLVFFFDEAHLLFDDASKAFLDQVEQVVRMIRSKGVGIFFVTQTPKDVPGDVLAQLSNRVQHALRAFTPDDEKALKATANTFPRSEFYDIPRTIQSLGIGEALVTVLSERGTPTPVVATRMAPPASLMGPIPASDRSARVSLSAMPIRPRWIGERARGMLLARIGGRGPGPGAARGAGGDREAPTVAGIVAGDQLAWPARSGARVSGISGCSSSQPPARRRRITSGGIDVPRW